MKKSLFQTNTAHIFGASDQLKSLASFIREIREADVRIRQDDFKTILNTKTLRNTPIDLIFKNMLEDKKDNIFVGLNIPSSYNVPELIAGNVFTLDTLQFKDMNPGAYNIIATFPEFKDKIIVNLTPLLRSKTPTHVNDMNMLQSMFVRDMLVRSYFKQDNWLTPDSVKLLAETYSYIVGELLSNSVLKPNYNELQVIKIILTAYFYLNCNTVENGTWPGGIKNCGFLGDGMTINNVLNEVHDIMKGDLHAIDLDTVCALIRETGPGKFKNLSTHTLYTRCPKQDNIQVATGLEYPPYWAHQIILAVSGYKSSFYAMLNKNKKLLGRCSDFATALARSNSFIPEL